MPIYEYRCQQCEQVFGHRFRTLKAAEEGEAPPCPACGVSDVERLISPAGVLSGEASNSEQGGKISTESK